MAYTNTVCTAASVPSTLRQNLSSQSVFGSRIKAALEHASRLTEMRGTKDIDAIIAWEAVRELLAKHPYFSTLMVSNWSLEDNLDH